MEQERIGRYVPLRVLGRGAAAVVYEAHDPVIDRRVALKVLRTDLSGQPAEEFRTRFLREARAAGRLSHPGIVTIYDVGEDPDSGVVFLAMELVEGQTLKEILASGERFEPAQVAQLGRLLAEALDAAHTAGVVHRDVKPANVLLTPAGAVKIADFGVARLDASEITRDGTTVGTPYYMAPEQAVGAPVDRRADLWSLGVILYELLAGERPFTGGGIGELAMRIIHDPPPDLGQRRPDVAATLAPVVHRLLAKAPADRFQNAREVAASLAPFAASSVVLDPRQQTPPPLTTEDANLETRVPTDGSMAAGILAASGAVRRGSLAAAAAAVVIVVLGLLWLAGSDGTERPPPIVALGPEFEVAAGVAEPTPERTAPAAGSARTGRESAAVRPTVAPRRPTRTPIVAPTATPAVIATPTPTPVPAPAVLEVVFASPLSTGSLVFEAGGERLHELRWDFSEKGAFGLRRAGEGEVIGRVRIPPGPQRLEVQLHAGARGQIGMRVFERSFAPGSRWQLVVEMASRRARPSFALEPAAG